MFNKKLTFKILLWIIIIISSINFGASMLYWSSWSSIFVIGYSLLVIFQSIYLLIKYNKLVEEKNE